MFAILSYYFKWLMQIMLSDSMRLGFNLGGGKCMERRGRTNPVLLKWWHLNCGWLMFEKH